jgi:chromosome segregation ATPase
MPKIPDLQEMLTWFRDSDAGKQLVADHEAKIQAQRDQARAEIERLSQENQAKLPELLKAKQAAEKKFLAARAAYKTAALAYSSAQAEMVGTAAAYEAQASSQRRLLYDLSDGERIDDLRRELEALHRQCEDLIVRSAHMEFDLETGADRRVGTGNYDKVRTRSLAILRAIQESQEWKWLGLSGAELEARIQALRESIPNAEPVFQPGGRLR